MYKMWMVLPLLILALLSVSGCGEKKIGGSGEKKSGDSAEKVKCKLTSGEYKCSCLHCRGTNLECRGHKDGKKECELWCKKCKKQSVITERIAPY